MSFRIRKLFIVGLLVGCSEGDISVLDTKWDCDGSKCQVTFALQKQTLDEIEVNYSIRAHKRVHIAGSENLVNDIVGEVNGQVGLYGQDVREVVQVVKVIGSPTNIVVSAWQK